MKLKGPMFPSFKEPPYPKLGLGQAQIRRSLPPGKSWIHHDGTQARTRRLRQMCGSIVSSKDPDVLDALQRVREISQENEAGFYYVVSKAKAAAEANDLSIAVALNYMVDHIHDNDKKAEEEAENQPIEEPKNEL